MKSLSWKCAVLIFTFVIGVAALQLTRALRNTQFQRPKLLKSETSKVAEPELTATDEDVPVEGRYANFDYAYSVLVPRGMMGLMNSTPPNPNHGFGIDLTNPQSISWIRDKKASDATLWVDASYDAADYRSPSFVIQKHLAWLREEHSSVRLVTKTSTRLGYLPAVRFVIAYQDSRREMIRDTIVAFRSQIGDGSDIIYTVDLRTTASRYNRDKQRLVDIQRSWIIDPLPNDYPDPPVNEGNN